MYTNEIFNHLKELDNNIAFSEYIKMYHESPQIKGVTYNAIHNKYEMLFADTKETLLFQIYNG